jgi:hypothetical protein
MYLKFYIEPFNNNTWTEKLINYFPHTKSNFDECDYVVSSKIPYGSIDSQYIQDVLLSYANSKKPTIVFLFSDFNEPFHIPQNVLLFRSGMYKSKRNTNEHIIPFIYVQDDLKGEIGFSPLSKKGVNPTVGFCGTLTSHPCRIQHLNTLKMSPSIKTKLILRGDYWAGKPHDKQVVDKFIKNIQETYFTLCSRGAGNWSARFYQVLYLGRIPIVVNTDMMLPLEDKINWRDVIVYCESDTEIPTRINEFWQKKDIVQAQMRCKEIYEGYLAPERWCKIITDEILIPFKNKLIIGQNA